MVMSCSQARWARPSGVAAIITLNAAMSAVVSRTMMICSQLTCTTNVIFRCPDLVSLHDKGQAYRFIILGPEGTWSTIVAINGRDQWRFSIIRGPEGRELTREEIHAAIRRAGMLRVDALQDLFVAAETLARFRASAEGPLAIMTNGGGAGVGSGLAAGFTFSSISGGSAVCEPQHDPALVVSWQPQVDSWCRSSSSTAIGPPLQGSAVVKANSRRPVPWGTLPTCPTGRAGNVKPGRLLPSCARRRAARSWPLGR